MSPTKRKPGATPSRSEKTQDEESTTEKADEQPAKDPQMISQEAELEPEDDSNSTSETPKPSAKGSSRKVVPVLASPERKRRRIDNISPAPSESQSPAVKDSAKVDEKRPKKSVIGSLEPEIAGPEEGDKVEEPAKEAKPGGADAPPPSKGPQIGKGSRGIAPARARTTTTAIPRLQVAEEAPVGVRRSTIPVRRSSPHRTRGFTSHSSAMTSASSVTATTSTPTTTAVAKAESTEDTVAQEIDIVGGAEEDEGQDDGGQSTGGIGPSGYDAADMEPSQITCDYCAETCGCKAEWLEHVRFSHRDAAIDLPRVAGTLLCAHPHCGLTVPDIAHLIVHLAGYHRQHNYRVSEKKFSTLDAFDRAQLAWEEASKSKFMSNDVEREVAPGISEMELYCECSDDWRQAQKEGVNDQVLVGCPAHMKLTVDKTNEKVTAVGCFAHLGHLKRASWTMVISESDGQTRRSLGGAMSKSKCNRCNQWFRSRTALANHRKIDHPDDIRMSSLMCGDPDCDEVADTMLTLCEHVVVAHKREDLLVEEYRFPSMVEFEQWKEKMEADTMSYFTKVSGKQKAAATGPNADCFFRYYQCHLSGFVDRSRAKHTNDDSRIKLRNRSSKKMGRFCTAFMNIKINETDGTVLMKGCLGHFGHDCDVRKVPIPSGTRLAIMDLLRRGVTEEDVIAIIKGKSAPHERGYYLQKYEVKNIVKKMIKESKGDIYYKYDDETDLTEEDGLAPWNTLKRGYQHTMYRPSLAHPRRRGIGTYQMQFSQLIPRKRRLVVRGGPQEHGDLHMDDGMLVGAEEEYYEDGGDETAQHQLGVEYDDDDPSEAAHQLRANLLRAESPTPAAINTPALRKLARQRIPLLKDASAQDVGRGFENAVHAIQTKVRHLTDQLKTTKDTALAESLMEDVRSMEARISKIIPQTSMTSGFLDSAGGTRYHRQQPEQYYEMEEEVDGGLEETEYYEEEEVEGMGPSRLVYSDEHEMEEGEMYEDDGGMAEQGMEDVVVEEEEEMVDHEGMHQMVE